MYTMYSQNGWPQVKTAKLNSDNEKGPNNVNQDA